MTRMNRVVAVGALLLAAVVPEVATAGIEPVPWHVLIANRSDSVLPDSPFFQQPMTGVVVYFVVQDRLSDVIGGTRVIEYPLAGVAIPAGQRTALTIPLQDLAAGASILSWGFTAKMGVEPMPWRVFAMEKISSPPAEPTTWPPLPAVLLSPEYGLYAFASPGTPVGEVTAVSQQIFGPCPPWPVDVEWKNHGQYVRCVALLVGDLFEQGVVTDQEADAIVSAAARSSAGK